MAISYVGGQVAGRAGNTSSTTITFALTGGTNATPQPNDLVVITAVVGSQGRNPAQAISGYTALGQLNPTATTYDTSLNVSYKVMGNTPDLTFTLPSTGNIADAQRYTVQVFRGVDVSGLASASATGTGTGRPDAPSITPTVAGSWVVLCGGGAAATGASYTGPTNFTTNFLTGSTADTNDAMVGSGYWGGWTSGAVNPAAYTGGTTGANDSWAIYSIVLPPAADVTRGNLTYVDSLSGGDSTFTVSSVSVSAPTVAVGDLEIIEAASAFLAPTTAPILATPAGWERAGYGASVPSAGALVNTRAHVFWRISPDTGSSATLDAGATAVFVYTRSSYSNPDPTSPCRQVNFGSTGAATGLSFGSLDVLDNSLLQGFTSLGAAQTVTAPGSMNVRENDATFGVSATDEDSTATGSTGTRAFTWSSSSESVWAFGEFLGASAGGASHDTSGALVGQGSTVAGSAAHVAVHGTSGDLTGPGSSVVGSAARTRAHPTSGVLTGQGSSIVGSARHNVPHPSSGALTGQGSTVTGSAARTRVHPSSGALTGAGALVAGAAARTRVHPSSGALAGPGSVVNGAAARTRVHPTSGVLTGPGAVIAGDADRQGGAGTHDATGDLVGPGSVVAGSAARFRAFSTSGALVGPGSALAGSAARVDGPVSHATSGVLVGLGSVVNGSANRTGAAVTHDTSGDLVGPGSLVVGVAQNGELPDTPFGGGFFTQALRRRLFEEEMREKLKELPEQVAEVIENTVIESIDRPKRLTQKQLREVFERENVPYREAYRQAVVSLVQDMRQREEEEEEEEAIAFAFLV